MRLPARTTAVVAPSVRKLFVRAAVLPITVASFMLAAALHAQPVERLSATPVWTSDDAGNATPSRPARFAVDANGRVFVPEPSESVLYVYGPTGTFLGRIGRKGSGPGEFQNICCAAFDPKGRLWARDIGGARYVVFSLAFPGGKLQSRPLFVVKMPHADVNRWIALGFDRSGALFDTGLMRREDDASSPQLISLLVDTAGRVVRSLVVTEQSANITPSFVVTTTNAGTHIQRDFIPPFAARPLSAHGPNGVYAHAGGAKYEVIWRNADGTVKHTIRRVVDGPLLAEAERKRAQLELAETARSAGKRVSELPFGVPDRKPPLRALEFDLEGRLWIERYVARGALRESDVYGTNGTLAFTVVWPALPNITFYGAARGREAWITTQDDDDIPHIVKLSLSSSR